MRDLRRWIDESRNTERFIVLTIIVGALSIITGLGKLKEKKKTRVVAADIRQSESDGVRPGQ